MTAQSTSFVDSLLSNWQTVAIVVSLCVAALVLVGCGQSALARIGVDYATHKVIDGDGERARRIVAIVDAATLAVDNEQASSIEALEEVVRSKIDWARLDRADQALANILIETVSDEVQRRLEPSENEPAAPWRLKAKTVLGWVRSAAVTEI